MEGGNYGSRNVGLLSCFKYSTPENPFLPWLALFNYAAMLWMKSVYSSVGLPPYPMEHGDHNNKYKRVKAPDVAARSPVESVGSFLRGRRLICCRHCFWCVCSVQGASGECANERILCGGGLLYIPSPAKR